MKPERPLHQQDGKPVPADTDYDEELGRLTEALEPVEPPPSVWDAIAPRIADGAPQTRVSFWLADPLGWTDIGGGISFKLLSQDRISGCDTFMVRMDAGASYGYHYHPVDEECLVIEGRMRMDGREYGPGDWELAPMGTSHDLVEALTPLVVYVKGRLPEGVAA